MSAVRIIPCLDVKEGRVVKGVHFNNLVEAGNPVEHAIFYNNEKADELVLLDISATTEGRKTITSIVTEVSENITIPLIIGGGIKNLQDIENLLKAGADKISISTAAVKNPEIIKESVKRFGNQRIIIAIDSKKISENRWEVYIEGGEKPTGMESVEWARKIEELGAGEILLTSIDRDGTQEGYDVAMTRAIADNVKIPVIASGGAGTLKDMEEVVVHGKANAVLLASLLHFRRYTIAQIKDYLNLKGIEVSN